MALPRPYERWKLVALGPPEPVSDIHPRRGGAFGPLPILLVKTGCTLDESLDRSLGHPQPIPAEMVAKEVENPFGLAELPLWVMFDRHGTS